MQPRIRLALAVAAACAVGLAAALLVSGRGGGDGRSEALSSPFAGALRPSAIPPEDFSLRDQDGHNVALRDYAGQVVVLTFLYSTCRDTCPLVAQQIRGALDQLGRAVPVLAVSVDPAGDTPLHARRFLIKQSVAGRMRFLLGSSRTLAPIWRAFGIRPQSPGTPSRSDHSVDVVLIDKAGRQRIGFPADQLTPESLAHDIRKLAAEPLRGRARRRRVRLP
jgi:protein SCO1/2